MNSNKHQSTQNKQSWRCSHNKAQLVRANPSPYTSLLWCSFSSHFCSTIQVCSIVLENCSEAKALPGGTSRDARMLNHRNIVVKKSTAEEARVIVHGGIIQRGIVQRSIVLKNSMEARGMMAWAKVWRTGGGFNAKMSRARSRLCNYWRRRQSWKCCNTAFHTNQCSNKC